MVSGGDFLVSGGDASPPFLGTELQAETLWSKPIDLYTPTEGFLFLIFCIFLTFLVIKFMEGFKWLR